MSATQGEIDSDGAGLTAFAEVALDGATMTAPPQHSLGEFRTAIAMYRSLK